MVKVKALRNCRFGYEGTEYVFSIGEEKEIDVPIEKIDTNSFEVVGESVKKEVKKKKEEIEKKEEDDE